MKSSVIIGVLWWITFPLMGQNHSIEIKKIAPADVTVCYGKDTNEHTYVAPPRAFNEWRSNPSSRTKTATFEVTYINFSVEAKNAFQAAVDIWSTLITSDIPIRITATWEPLGAGVLGSASAGTFIRDFPGAQRQRTWYPVALAEKISGREFNGEDADIQASFNSNNSSWFFGTSGGTPTGKYDLVSIVLHEIGHGLGINHNYSVSGANGIVSGDLVFTYLTYIENGSGQNLVTNFTQPSAALRTQLTSRDLFFNSPSVAKAKIYAPATFSAGSSIAHVDEDNYPAGNANSLMSPQIGFAEVIHDPGPIAMGMLNDMGWTRTLIQHNALLNTETLGSPYPVKATVISDKPYNASSVKLHYTTNGTTFAVVAMSPTGISNEFSADLPSSGSPITYGYYLSVNDNNAREWLRPGKIFLQGQAAQQALFQFEAGQDTKAPKIVHDPKQFLIDTDTKLVLNAVISDNIGIQDVKVEYLINGVSQPSVAMTLTVPADSLYEATINFSPLLTKGNVVKYRIIATDNSVAHNKTTVPSATTYFEVPVTGLLPSQSSYANNFNVPTSAVDFFGDNLFSVQTPAGFTNGAIHTSHPYPNGSGQNNQSNFSYQLRVPVVLRSANSFVCFDEIVLVEPSDEGAAFGSSGFYDYVIVEGSKDGGATWKPLLDGYNSRSQSVWLTKFNSATDNEEQPNSTASGDPALYKPRSIDLLAAGNFSAGDEVVVRFRLYADQLVHGWGWAIDNLRIQIDEEPPLLLHDHLNYQVKGNELFKISVNATDGDAVTSLTIDYQINDQPVNTFDFPVTAGTSDYTLNQTITGLSKGDVFKYKIRAKDPSGNERTLPETDFFYVPVIEFNPAVTQYVSDFNSANTDFVGNFFTISQPAGFTSGLIHTFHPYPNGFGSDKTSDFIYLLKTPVIISESNPLISFDEVVLVESGANTDYVTVECSKDSGVTWEAIVATYNSSANSSWNTAFTSSQDGKASLLKNRLINMTSNGKLKAGDQALIRFRLLSNATKNGWGWAIDNLSIQGPVTGIENTLATDVQVYPNPVSSDYFTIELPPLLQGSAISVINMQGQPVANTVYAANEESKSVYVGNLSDGVYLVRVNTASGLLTKKILIKR